MNNTNRQTFIKLAAEIVKDALAKQQTETKPETKEREH